jgi:hypothetical protein
VRRVDPSVLSFSLSLHRHPYLCIPCILVLSIHDKILSFCTGTCPRYTSTISSTLDVVIDVGEIGNGLEKVRHFRVEVIVSKVTG